jgi:hypothetical protein
MLSTSVQGSQELYISKYMITFMYQYVVNFLYVIYVCVCSFFQMTTSVHNLRNTADWVRSFLTNRRQKVEVQLSNRTENFSLTGV